MSKYVITAIAVVRDEVEQAQIARLEREPENGQIGFNMPKVVDRAELASLLRSDEVFLAHVLADGTYEIGCRVRTKPGQMEYATGADADGTPNNEMRRLPLFAVQPDDD